MPRLDAGGALQGLIEARRVDRGVYRSPGSVRPSSAVVRMQVEARAWRRRAEVQACRRSDAGPGLAQACAATGARSGAPVRHVGGGGEAAQWRLVAIAFYAIQMAFEIVSLVSRPRSSVRIAIHRTTSAVARSRSSSTLATREHREICEVGGLETLVLLLRHFKEAPDRPSERARILAPQLCGAVTCDHQGMGAYR